MSIQSFGGMRVLEKMKQMKKQDWIVVILIGILLLIVALPSTSTKESTGTYGNLEEENETNSYRKELEKELCEILSEMTGVGNVKVMITLKEENSSYFSTNQSCEVEGVVVVAEGGDNAVVANDILEVVMSLFPVDAHKITIVKMKVSEA